MVERREKKEKEKKERTRKGREIINMRKDNGYKRQKKKTPNLETEELGSQKMK